jgi:hypothetical protein
MIVQGKKVLTSAEIHVKIAEGLQAARVEIQSEQEGNGLATWHGNHYNILSCTYRTDNLGNSGTSKRVSLGLAKNVEISPVNQSVKVSIWHEPVQQN